MSKSKTFYKKKYKSCQQTSQSPTNIKVKFDDEELDGCWSIIGWVTKIDHELLRASDGTLSR
jgi:hypothetical protein